MMALEGHAPEKTMAVARALVLLVALVGGVAASVPLPLGTYLCDFPDGPELRNVRRVGDRVGLSVIEPIAWRPSSAGCYLARDRDLYDVPVNQSGKRHVCRLASSSFGALGVSPDGWRVASIVWSKQVSRRCHDGEPLVAARLLVVKTDTLTRLANVPLGLCESRKVFDRHLKWSPDGRYVAGYTGLQDAVHVYDLTSQRHLRLFAGAPDRVQAVAWDRGSGRLLAVVARQLRACDPTRGFAEVPVSISAPAPPAGATVCANLELVGTGPTLCWWWHRQFDPERIGWRDHPVVHDAAGQPLPPELTVEVGREDDLLWRSADGTAWLVRTITRGEQPQVVFRLGRAGEPLDSFRELARLDPRRWPVGQGEPRADSDGGYATYELFVSPDRRHMAIAVGSVYDSAD